MEFLTVPLQDKFKTTLLQQCLAGASSAVLATAPNFTIPVGQSVYVGLDWDNGSYEVRKATNISGNTLTLDVTPIARWYGDTPSSIDHGAGAKVIISHTWNIFQDIADAIASKANIAGVTFTGTVDFNSTTARFTPPRLTTVQRLALVAPPNGTIVFDTDDGILYQRIGGSWTTFASGATPIASDGVAGKVDIATTAEVIAGTTTDPISLALNALTVANTITAPSGGSDQGKIPVIGSGNTLPDGFISNNIKDSEFGDASDGDFHATVDTTLNPTYKIFQYDDFIVDSGKTLTFGNNFKAKPIIVLVRGNLNLNGATVDVSGLGYAGGAAVTSGDGNDGVCKSAFTNIAGRGGISGFQTTPPGGGGAGGAAPGANTGEDLFGLPLGLFKIVYIGAGGGSGAPGGATGAGSNPGDGGKGGDGGGGILFLVAGNIDVTNATLKADGQNGDNGTQGTNGGQPNVGGGGAGGGGQGGSFKIGYKGTKTGNPSIHTADGGTGGTGGLGNTLAAGGTPSGGGGGGSGGGSEVDGNNGQNNKSTGGPDAGDGGNGSDGGTGFVSIEKLIPA